MASLAELEADIQVNFFTEAFVQKKGMLLNYLASEQASFYPEAYSATSLTTPCSTVNNVEQ
jgi:hypothetical protein